MKGYVKVICIFWMLLIFFNTFYRNSNEVSREISSRIASKITDRLAVNAVEGGNGKEASTEVSASNDKKANVEANNNKTVNAELNNWVNASTLSKRINYTIRKSGHFFQYLILAILMTYLLRQNISAGSNREVIFITLFICLFIANLDEYCQSFLSYRTSLVKDVFMDLAGSLVGMMLTLVFINLSEKQIKRV